MLYKCKITEHTRNSDKHQKTFCGRKENICLASHTVEQCFQILFTSSQEGRHFYTEWEKGTLKMAIMTLISFSPINICSKSPHNSHYMWIRQCQNCFSLAELSVSGDCDPSSNVCSCGYLHGGDSHRLQDRVELVPASYIDSNGRQHLLHTHLSYARQYTSITRTL